MKAKLLLVAAALTSILLIVSGRGQHEPDELAYVVALGLDKGKGNALALTIQMAVPKAFGQAGGGGGSITGQQQPYINTSIEVPNTLGALDVINSYTDRRINLMHVQAIIFGSSLARAGLANYVGVLSRYREIRQTMMVFVARGTAKEFIENLDPKLETSTAKYLMLAAKEGQRTNRTLPIPFYKFIAASKSHAEQGIAQLVSVNRRKNVPVASTKEPRGEPKPSSQALAGELARKGDVKVEFMGTALFDGDRQIGSLNGTETIFLSVLRGELGQPTITIRDPNNKRFVISLRLHQHRRPAIRIHKRGNQIALTVKCWVDADLLAIQSGINYERPALSRKLEKQVGAEFERRAGKVLAKLKRLGTDATGFGRVVRAKFWTEPAFEKFDWLSRFQKTPVRLQVYVHIRHTDLMLKMFPVVGRKSAKQGVKPFAY